MNIWIIDHYSVPVKYYPLARQRNFARYLLQKGHDVTIFCASSVHNSSINLIEDNSLYKELYADGIRYIAIKCTSYHGNGIKRIYNMLEFAYKLPKVLRKYHVPQIIIATSMTQFACAQGIRFAKRYGCKVIAQITDLWPETLVAYGLMTKRNLAVVLLRWLEKWTYKNADRIIFSMKGAYDYIREQKWQKEIPEYKVIHINNGVDLGEFRYNKDNYRNAFAEFENQNEFKVVYTGSIRRVNNVGKILDVAKLLIDRNIVFLIFGKGEEMDELIARAKAESISNVKFMGAVEKRFIPDIVSCADLNFAHNSGSAIFRYGISFNKIFDYFAAGKPILTDFDCKYNPVLEENAGVNVSSGDAREIADAIERMAALSDEEYSNYCNNSLRAAEKYDFKRLTKTLEDTIFACVEEY